MHNHYQKRELDLATEMDVHYRFVDDSYIIDSEANIHTAFFTFVALAFYSQRFPD